MVKRNASGQEEPEQKQFDLPSAKEHLFQVSDILEDIDSDPDIVHAKCEVVGGDEEGRTLLNRLSLDDKWKGFFATRLFLKAVGCEYKGDNFPIDTDEWQGRQFYATVIHKSGYANIKEFNFEKMIEKSEQKLGRTNEGGEVVWDE